MRKLHLNSGMWSYKIGNQYAVIRDPNRKSTIVPLHILTVMSVEAFEHSRWRDAVKPRHVKTYIEENLLVDKRDKS